MGVVSFLFKKKFFDFIRSVYNFFDVVMYMFVSFVILLRYEFEEGIWYYDLGLDNNSLWLIVVY